MKNVLAWFGATLVIMAMLGAFGPFDFRMCFGPKGYCTPVPSPRGVLSPPLT